MFGQPKWKVAIFLLFVLFFVVPVLQLIFRDFTFAGNATHAPGLITSATNSSVGTEGDFVQAFWQFWPALLAVICIGGLFALIGKKITQRDIHLD